MEAEFKRVCRRLLGELPDKPQKIDEKILVFPFSLDLAFAAFHYLRTPSRVLWDLFATKSNKLEPLYNDVLEWVAKDERPWLADERGISIEVRGTGPVQAGPLQIRGVIKNGLIEGAKRKGLKLYLEPEQPDLHLVAAASEQGLLISWDLSGGSRHRRGYRRHVHEASLKETLAAQMIILSRWNPKTEILIEPMAGAGTLGIEALKMARGEPVWTEDTLPRAHALLFADRPRPKALFGDTAPRVFLNDADHAATKALKANLREAHEQGTAVLLEGDFRQLAPTQFRTAHEPVLILCNPPYGERLDQYEAEELSRALFTWAKTFGENTRVALISPFDLLEVPGFRRAFMKPMQNGNLPVWFQSYEIR